MAAELFPRELTRKQYGLRLVGVFAFVAAGLFLFVAALISGYVYLGWVVVAWIYAGFGLAVPRLRNAGKPVWWALFFFVPRLNIVAAIVLLIVKERSKEPGPTSQEGLRLTRENMRKRLRGAEPEQAPEAEGRGELRLVRCNSPRCASLQRSLV
jgi:membrane protein implicated in regulation of membrane protease activity